MNAVSSHEQRMAAIEIAFLSEALKKAKTQRGAAKLLGIPRTTFITKWENLTKVMSAVVTETSAELAFDVYSSRYHVVTSSGNYIGTLQEVCQRTTNAELRTWVHRGTLRIITMGD